MLINACEKGHKEVVKLLLNSDKVGSDYINAIEYVSTVDAI